MSHSADGFDPDAPGRRFDAVLVDIDHSPRNLLHPRHAALYQPEGLARLAAHLHPGGVFALWSNDPPDDAFERVLAGAFATSATHVVTFDNSQGDHDRQQHRLCRGQGGSAYRGVQQWLGADASAPVRAATCPCEPGMQC